MQFVDRGGYVNQQANMQWQPDPIHLDTHSLLCALMPSHGSLPPKHRCSIFFGDGCVTKRFAESIESKQVWAFAFLLQPCARTLVWIRVMHEKGQACKKKNIFIATSTGRNLAQPTTFAYKGHGQKGSEHVMLNFQDRFW